MNPMWTDMLAGAVRAHQYFKEDRLEYAQAAARRAPPEPRAGPKVACNDSYPCGSGKKYKRCCGSSDTRGETVH